MTAKVRTKRSLACRDVGRRVHWGGRRNSTNAVRRVVKKVGVSRRKVECHLGLRPQLQRRAAEQALTYVSRDARRAVNLAPLRVSRA